MWTAEAAGQSMKFTTAGEILVSYLPLSHIAAQIIDIYLPILHGHTVHFAEPDALKVIAI
jgi:long-chain-fatty-acid--CoA ligase ACSBG